MSAFPCLILPTFIAFLGKSGICFLEVVWCDFQSLGLDSLEGPGVMFRRLKPPPLDACN